MSFLDSENRIVFLPGLAADQRLFHYQLQKFPQAHVPQWLSVEPDESLADYAKRWAQSITFKPGDAIAGMSFGGQVALELAKHLPAKAVLLISANRRASEISQQFRLQQQMLRAMPEPLLKTMLKNVGIAMMKAGEDLDEVSLGLLGQMVDDLDVSFLKWAAKAAADWDYEFNSQDFSMPIYQIHGENDKVILLSNHNEVDILPGASHLINYTHHQELNSWLQEKLQASS